MINKSLLTLLLSMTALPAMEAPTSRISIHSLLNPTVEQEEDSLTTEWQEVESIGGTIDSLSHLQPASSLPQILGYESCTLTPPEAGQKRKHDAITIIIDEEEEIASGSVISFHENVAPDLFSKTYYLNLIESFDLQETKNKKEVLNFFYKNLLGVINLDPKVREHFLKEIVLGKNVNAAQGEGREALNAFVDALTTIYQLTTIKGRCRRDKVERTQLDSQSQEILIEIGRVAAVALSRRQNEITEQRPAKRLRNVAKGCKLNLKQRFMEDIINMVPIEECESLLSDIYLGNRRKLEELIRKIQDKYCDAENIPLKLKTLSGRLTLTDIETKFPPDIAWIRDAANKAVIERNYKELLSLIGSHSSSLSSRQAS